MTAVDSMLNALAKDGRPAWVRDLGHFNSATFELGVTCFAYDQLTVGCAASCSDGWKAGLRRSSFAPFTQVRKALGCLWYIHSDHTKFN